MPVKVVLFLAAIVQAAAPLILYFNGFDERTGRAPSPIVPANYAFSIWAVIYGLSLIYAVIALMPGHGGPLFDRIGWPVIALFALSTMWLGFARYGPLWATVPTILAMLALALFALMAVTDPAAERRGLEGSVTIALFGLYAGWLTIASLANFTEIAAASGFKFFGLSPQGWAIGGLAVGTAVSCLVAAWLGGPWSYAAAVCWAFAGIAIANLRPETRPAVVAVALIGFALMLATSWVAARPAPPEQAAEPTA